MWIHSEIPDVRFVAAWALSRLPLVNRELMPLGEGDDDTVSALQQIDFQAKPVAPGHDRCAACVVGYYLQKPWSEKKELLEKFATAYEKIPTASLLQRSTATANS